MIKSLLIMVISILILNADNVCKDLTNANKKNIINNHSSNIFRDLSYNMIREKKVIRFNYHKFTNNTCQNYYDYKITLKLINNVKKYTLLNESFKVFNSEYKFFLKPQSALLNIPDNKDFIFYRITNINFSWKSKKKTKPIKVELLNNINKNSYIIALNKIDKMFYFSKDGYVRNLIWSINKNTTLAIGKIYHNGKLTTIKENKQYKATVYNQSNSFKLINNNSIITYIKNQLYIRNEKTNTILTLIHSKKYSNSKNIVLKDKKNNKKYLLKQIGFKNKQFIYSLRSIDDDFVSKVIAYRFSLKEI